MFPKQLLYRKRGRGGVAVCGFGASVRQLLRSGLVSSFARRGLRTLSLFAIKSVGTVKVRGLSTVPEVKGGVICSIGRIFTTVRSRSPLLRMGQCYDSRIVRGVSVYCTRLYRGIRSNGRFRTVFPSSLRVLGLVYVGRSGLVRVIGGCPRTTSYLCVCLIYLGSLVLSSHGSFCCSIGSDTVRCHCRINDGILKVVLCSRLSGGDELLLRSRCSIVRGFFNTGSFVRLRPFVRSELACRLNLSRVCSAQDLSGRFYCSVRFGLGRPLGSCCSFSLLARFMSTCASLSFRRSNRYAVKLFPFVSSGDMSFIASFRRMGNCCPVFALFSSCLRFKV